MIRLHTEPPASRRPTVADIMVITTTEPEADVRYARLTYRIARRVFGLGPMQARTYTWGAVASRANRGVVNCYRTL